MLRHNIFACGKDTREGVRKPRFSNAARSGPYPPLDPAQPTDDGPPRRPSFNAIGTVNTPVVVLSERLRVAGSRASAWGGIPTPARRSPGHGGDQTGASSYNDMSVVEGAASGKVVIMQGADSSGRDTDPPAERAAFASAESNCGATEKDGCARISSAVGPSGSGVGLVLAGASGRGLMTGADLAGNADPIGGSSAPPRQDDSSRTNLAPTTKEFPPPRNTLSMPSSDLASSESGSVHVAGGSSGRNIIRRGESNEHESGVPPLMKGSGLDTDQISGPVRRTGGAGGSDKFAFRLLKSSTPAESDIPKHRGIVGLTAAAASSSSSLVPGSDRIFGDEQLGGVGNDDSNGNRSSRGITSGFARLPWGAAGPTEIDIPRRRSVETSGRIGRTADSGAESEPSKDLDERKRHCRGQSEGGQTFGDAFPRLPAHFRKNPTEGTLPRRRSVNAPAWGLPAGGSGCNLNMSGWREKEEGTSSPDDSGSGGGTGDARAEEKGDLSRWDASDSQGSSRRGGPGTWGLKGRSPVVVDLPRRSSGYSADTSSRSIEGKGLVGRSSPQQFDESVDDSIADQPRGDGDGAAGGGFDRQRTARASFGMGASFALAGLVSGNPRPVESAIPRRRRLSDCSLPEGVVDTSKNSGDHTSGASPGEEVDKSGSAVSASRAGSISASARRAWPGGLSSRVPVAIDLPRRSSGYSVDTSGRSMSGVDVAGGQSLPQQQSDAEDRGADGTRKGAEGEIGSVSHDSSGNLSASAGRKSLFPALVGHKRAPVESDLPRRRPSEYSAAEGAGMADDAVDSSSREAEVGVHDSQNIESKKQIGKGLDVLGFEWQSAHR